MSNVTNMIVLWQKLDLIRNIDKNTSETSDCVRRLRGMWNVKEYHVAERFTVCPEWRMIKVESDISTRIMLQNDSQFVLSGRT